ncbi:GGDEF domain-containing protein [Patescibacteria group bacterium]|nr:GGDEF domain-containing protein [Patescibacteria group bacterium]MBU1938300.1 GGDEF domain-containing protein [Patescibacteria group bacterium]
MRRICKFHQWSQNDLPETSRELFEEKKTISGIQSEDETSMADTVRVPERYLEDEEEPSPPTLRSAQLRTVLPKILEDAQMETATGVRSSVSETMEEEITRLEREKAAMERELERQRLEIEELRNLVIIDKLTGLHTRNYFEDRILQAADEAVRYGTNFSLILVDLDKFKPINDELGHQAGDEALRLVGKIINETFRPSDVKCRYGGEELVIILPETEKQEAQIAAERLREAIESQLKPHLRQLYGEKAEAQMCTASIGVTSYLDAEPRTEKDKQKLAGSIIAEADKALYEAKNGGRNKVKVYGEVPSGRTNKMIFETVMRKEELEQHSGVLKKIAEKTIPEELREEALRAAADSIRIEREREKAEKS